MVLKSCTRCLVYTPKGTKFAEARVVHTKDGVTLFFDNYKLKDARFHARVDFYDEQRGLMASKCELVIRRNPGFPDMKEPWKADCRIQEVMKIVQRQKDIRASVYIETTFRSKGCHSFYGTIRNLSAGGMYITTTQPLNKHEKIEFTYSFRTLERRYEAVILWGKAAPGGRYGYGCRFVHLTDSGEIAIRSYVYKKLMEQEKSKK